jgi:hypothetical protein
MRFRKLRIAWSAMCGIACVLLIALWVRSYWWQDLYFSGVSPSRHFGGSELTTSVGTYEGMLYVWHGHSENLGINGGGELNWQVGSNTGVLWRLGAYDLKLVNNTKSNWATSHSDTSHLSRQFQWNTSSNGDTLVCVAQWFPILCAALAAILPWFRWSKRFSLRTLLIATTLVAVVLGLIVYAAR